MYPYQRPTSSSEWYNPASHQQPGGAPLSQQQQQQRDRASSGSPEQTRSNMLGRGYQDEYRSAHSTQQQHPHHHHRSVTDTHEAREKEDRNASHGNRRWIEEQQQQQRPYAPSYPRQQTQPPPQQPGPFSHPSSPSHRPRTPTYQQQYSHHRPSQWDSVQSGPMSAPPSMVPRINPNAPPSSSTAANSAGSTQTSSGPLPHHTSPILPSLMRGSKNHSRLPSWGPHSSVNASNPLARTDGPAVAPSGATGGGNSQHGGSSGSGPLPPPMLPYRGQSAGLGDALTRSEFTSQGEKRKRPASESPPNNGATTTGATSNLTANTVAPGRQSSPTLRGDPMSMSSILGPSSRNGEMEKRRRLEGGIPSSAPYGTTIKMEGGAASSGLAPGVGSSGKFTAGNPGGSPASNLARRKWSGPIAEQAAQQAAAWRAQEQRWGSSRSPKIGMTPLGPEQRQTPPIGTMPPKRDNSPARGEGHKRQRSDGYPVQGSPLNRNLPLRAQSPLPHSKPRSTESSPTGYHQPLPAMSRTGNSPSKPFTSSKSGAGYYRTTSPPPPTAQMMTYHQHHQQQLHQLQQSGVSSSMDRQSHTYGQPSYHAYDSQGRPVEIDVDEVRGGAFAGHGNPTAPSMQDQSAYRHGVSYNDSRHRPAPPRPSAPSAKTPGGISTAIAIPANAAPVQPLAHHPKPSLSGQVVARPATINVKEREAKRRSLTPNALGPAKGLLAPWYEKMRIRDERVAQRPATVSKDFNQGPKVDSEAVWETLHQISRRGLGIEEADNLSKTRHLGNFRYDPRKTPLLSGELLQSNVGATLEVRVSGRHLGMGPLKSEGIRRARDNAWALGWRGRERKGAIDAVQQVDGGMGEENDDDAATADFWTQDALVNRKLWGSDVYTDDSDVVAMCLHSGWIEGPTVQDVPAWVPPGKATFAWRQMTKKYADQGLGEEYEASGNVEENSRRLQRLHSTADLSVVLRIAPKLIAYKGSQRGGVKSRSWGNGHDGVSLIVESVTLEEPGYASGERGLRNVKHRIDHLARLKTLAAIAMDTESDDRLAKRIQGGGLVDIRLAATVSHRLEPSKEKHFWMVDIKSGKVEA